MTDMTVKRDQSHVMYTQFSLWRFGAGSIPRCARRAMCRGMPAGQVWKWRQRRAEDVSGRAFTGTLEWHDKTVTGQRS